MEDEFIYGINIFVIYGIIIIGIFVGGLLLGRLIDSKSDKLLSNYQNAFTQCSHYCFNNSLQGYLRMVEENHLKCFCYNWSDNSIRERKNV